MSRLPIRRNVIKALRILNVFDQEVCCFGSTCLNDANEQTNLIAVAVYGAEQSATNNPYLT